LAHVAEGLRLTATVLTPVMPKTCEQLLINIGLPVATSFASVHAWSTVCTGAKVAEKCILFPPLEEPEVPAKA
jgi:methionyl-tRNA synthetase